MGPLFALLRRKGSGERQGAGSKFWSRPRNATPLFPELPREQCAATRWRRGSGQSLPPAVPSASGDLPSHPTFGAQQRCYCSLETAVKGADLCPSLPSAERSILIAGSAQLLGKKQSLLH